MVDGQQGVRDEYDVEDHGYVVLDGGPAGLDEQQVHGEHEEEPHADAYHSVALAEEVPVEHYGGGHHHADEQPRAQEGVYSHTCL